MEHDRAIALFMQAMALPNEPVMLGACLMTGKGQPPSLSPKL